MDSFQGTTTGQLSGILNRLEDPIFLVDEQRTVLFRNAAAQRVLKAKTGVSVHLGRLLFSIPAGNAHLERLVLECRRPPHAKRETCRALKLSRRTATKDWLVMISILPSMHSSAVSSTTFVVHLVGRLHPRQLPVAALHDLFGLTRKETDVLARLMRHESLRDIADRLMLSHETIRAYIKRIFRKCDVRSRTQLLALMQKISLFAYWTD